MQSVYSSGGPYWSTFANSGGRKFPVRKAGAIGSGARASIALCSRGLPDPPRGHDLVSNFGLHLRIFEGPSRSAVDSAREHRHSSERACRAAVLLSRMPAAAIRCAARPRGLAEGIFPFGRDSVTAAVKPQSARTACSGSRGGTYCFCRPYRTARRNRSTSSSLMTVESMPAPVLASITPWSRRSLRNRSRRAFFCLSRYAER